MIKAPVIILSLSPVRCSAPPDQLEQGLETENDPVWAQVLPQTGTWSAIDLMHSCTTS